MRADPVAWKDYLDEIALWDTLSGDGLENEEPYYTPEEEAALAEGGATVVTSSRFADRSILAG